MNLDTFPQAPAKLHLVGIGGIGMSALAQFLLTLGYEVSGSDRDLTTPAQVKLFDKLKKQGMQIFLQDGSGVRQCLPDAIIYSSAIEDDNPDFVASDKTARFHRSMAMAVAIKRSGMKQIAIAGSCGKTSVTGWLTSALQALGENPAMINGGYTNEFINENFPGNFKPGTGIVVYEADESDGSLVNFEAHTALLLNLGIDHHEKDKLEDFFSTFLAKSENICISNKLVYLQPEGKTSVSFTEDITSELSADFTAAHVTHSQQGTSFVCGDHKVCTSQFGNHSVANALAVSAVLKQNGYNCAEVSEALGAFQGVTRRFDYKGSVGLVHVYDDYAHNVQKIAACIQTAQNLSDAPVIAAFQPHGYGPLGFMRDALKDELRAVLRAQDSFIFLPVFYAGGTTSFKPKSGEVAEEYRTAGLNVSFLSERDQLKGIIATQDGSASLVVLGARDPSLVDWTASLVGVAE